MRGHVSPFFFVIREMQWDKLIEFLLVEFPFVLCDFPII